MQLSAEMFQQIVASLRSDERSCSGHEKRREGRVGMRCSVEVRPRVFDDHGWRQSLMVSVRDISPSGMGFITSERFAVGTELTCRLPRENMPAVEVPMRVRHCRAVSKNLYNVGVRFEMGADSRAEGTGDSGQKARSGM